MIPFCKPDLSRFAGIMGETIARGFIGPGKLVADFEGCLRVLTGAKHVIATTSGTIALWLAGRAAARRKSSPIDLFLPGYGIAATANALVDAMRPSSVRFIDINSSGWMSNKEILEAMAEHNPHVICHVDFGGVIPDHLPALRERCERRGVVLIEDAACGMGHRHFGKHAGTFGHIGCLSFSVPKLVTTGQGGAVLTDDDWYADFIRDLIYHGDRDRTGDSRLPGLNLRMTDMQAALGLAQIAEFDDILDHKRAVLSAMHQSIYQSGPSLFNVVHTRSADAMIALLAKEGVEARKQYRCLTNYTAYQHYGKGTSLLHSKNWEECAVYLPFGTSLTVADALRVYEAVQHVKGMLNG